VNQYTLIMDVLFPSTSTGWRALFQTSAGNGNDAEWFVSGGNGIAVMPRTTQSHADTWHRIALVVDLAQTNPTNKYLNYIDGVCVGYSSLGTGGGVDGRYSVWPAPLACPRGSFPTRTVRHNRVM